MDLLRLALLLHHLHHDHRVRKPDAKDAGGKAADDRLRHSGHAAHAAVPHQHWTRDGAKLQVTFYAVWFLLITEDVFCLIRFIYWRVCCFMCLTSVPRQPQVPPTPRRRLVRGRSIRSLPPRRTFSIRSTASSVMVSRRGSPPLKRQVKLMVSPLLNTESLIFPF